MGLLDYYYYQSEKTINEEDAESKVEEETEGETEDIDRDMSKLYSCPSLNGEQKDDEENETEAEVEENGDEDEDAEENMYDSKVNYLKTQLQDLMNEFTVNLYELKNSYPYFKTYTKDQTYIDRYENDKFAMDKTRGKIFLFKQTLEDNILSTLEKNKALILKINEIEKYLDEVLQKDTNLNNRSKGAEGAFDDIQQEYNQQLLKNFLIFFSCLILIYFTYKLKTN